jgi:hypothetical protein
MRSRNLIIRISPEEAEAFKRAAAEEHLGLSQWLRRLGLLDVDRKRALVVEPQYPLPAPSR